MKTITIKLTAPLQAYGNEATFNRRTTNTYPTKSAVVGMIAAALGYRRDDNRIQQLNDLSFAVRVDQPGAILSDFQIVEYAKSSTKKAKKLTYRDYLQDAVFLVAVGSENTNLIDNIFYALGHPKFSLFLGRRSNPPAGPLHIQKFDNKNPFEVLKFAPWQASEWYKVSFDKQNKQKFYSAEIVCDSNLLNEGFEFQQKDNFGSFNQRNRYHNYRKVISTRVKLTNNADKLKSETNHDIMSIL